MTDNQHESVARVQKYADHIAELTRRFIIAATYRTETPEAASAGTLVPRDARLLAKPFFERQRCVAVPVVIDETTYAVALHELGHCLHPTGMIASVEGSLTYRKHNQVATLRDMQLMLTEEESAWDWAQAHAIEWTDAMQAIKAYALGSYRKRARQLGVK